MFWKKGDKTREKVFLGVKYEGISPDFKKYADGCVKIVKETFHKDLDYSEDSLKILDSVAKEGWQGKKPAVYGAMVWF